MGRKKGKLFCCFSEKETETLNKEGAHKKKSERKPEKTINLFSSAHCCRSLARALEKKKVISHVMGESPYY
jgi:hypothetical protein